MAVCDDRKAAVVDHPVFDHEGPWTEHAYLTLPVGALPRAELVEGTLVVGPATSPTRARVVSRIRAALEAVLPEGLRVIVAAPLRLGPDCVLVPDLVVARALAEPLGVPPADHDLPRPEGEPSPGRTSTPVLSVSDPSVGGSEIGGSAAGAADGSAGAGPNGTRNPLHGTPPADSSFDGAPTDDPSAASAAAERRSGSVAGTPPAAVGPAVDDPAVDRRTSVAGSGPAPEVLDAGDALMVVEVVGREHGITDRSFKPQLYARGRIPYLLLVDHDGPFAVADMIIGGRYHEYARAAGAEALRVEEPFALEIDLATLAGGDTEPAARMTADAVAP